MSETEVLERPKRGRKPAAPEKRKPTKAEMWAGPKYKIVIENTSRREDPEDLFISVNGHHLLIKRGEPVIVPQPYVHRLENAKRTEYIQSTDGDGRPVMKKREVMAYPFRVLEGPLS